MKKLLLMLTVLVVLSFASCDVVQHDEQGKPYITAETAAKIERGVTTAEEVGQAATALGVIWAPLFTVGGIIGGAVGAWRKYRPKIEAAESNAKLAGSVAEALVETIEDFKVNKPSEWSDALKPHLMANLDREIEVEINRIKDK